MEHCNLWMWNLDKSGRQNKWNYMRRLKEITWKRLNNLYFSKILSETCHVDNPFPYKCDWYYIPVFTNLRI